MGKKIPTWEESEPIKSSSSSTKSSSSKIPTWEESEPVVEEPSMFQKAINVLDIPGSIVRTGIEAAESPEREVIPSVKQQIQRTIESPTTASSMAPNEEQTFEALSSLAFGKETPEQKAAKQKEFPIGYKVATGLGSLMTGVVTDPTNWFMPSKAVTKPIRKGLNSASERQAAKTVAKYATKMDITTEGVDPSIIGKRLVAEDLQGWMRNPEKLYKHLAGTRHIKVVGQNMPQTLSVRRGMPEGGKIAETSKEITDMLKTVESEYGLKPQLPMGVMYKQLLENAKTNISATSGETIDLQRTEEILKDVLKPYLKIEIPGEIYPTPPEVPMEANYYGALMKGDFEGIKNIQEGGLTKPIKQPSSEIAAIPAELSLTQMQELRKNIGKQVADKAFYAASDANVKKETEVLAELYGNIGDVIKNTLKGKRIKAGNTEVDAAEFYEAQNNKLKSFLDLKSILEYEETKNLKAPDMAAKVAGMIAQGTMWGGLGVGASMAGIPVSPLSAGLLGAGGGAAYSASKSIEASSPEYLTSILKSAGKVQSTPFLPEAIGRGAIQYAREGEFVPTLEPGREPNSVGMTPKQLVNYRIPRSTQGILEQKEKVIAKLAQSGLPSEMIDSVAHALNGDADDVSSIAPVIMTQFPTLFEKSKYKVFDGKFIDPNDKAKAADEISRRDDIDSIQRARMINKINKFGEVPEGL